MDKVNNLNSNEGFFSNQFGLITRYWGSHSPSEGFAEASDLVSEDLFESVEAKNPYIQSTAGATMGIAHLAGGIGAGLYEWGGRVVIARFTGGIPMASVELVKTPVEGVIGGALHVYETGKGWINGEMPDNCYTASYEVTHTLGTAALLIGGARGLASGVRSISSVLTDAPVFDSVGVPGRVNNGRGVIDLSEGPDGVWKKMPTPDKIVANTGGNMSENITVWDHLAVDEGAPAPSSIGLLRIRTDEVLLPQQILLERFLAIKDQQQPWLLSGPKKSTGGKGSDIEKKEGEPKSTVKSETPALEEQLAQKAGIAVRKRPGGMTLISYADCAKMIEACRSEGILITGIEGFYLTEGGKIIPEIGAIADYSELASSPSWEQACFESARSAALYFEALKDQPSLWFEFVLKEPLKN